MHILIFRLYLIPFLHQTTTINRLSLSIVGCILFHFYIKPQLFAYLKTQSSVVSYSISTSNHNDRLERTLGVDVVSYSISTSNHNGGKTGKNRGRLYLIPFLHQTTTVHLIACGLICCILFHFYIKPQRSRLISVHNQRCILFHFYIKPQPVRGFQSAQRRCILFHFYIKPQL